MKWENLQTKQCPHCESALDFGEAVGDEIVCTVCTFHIARRRFEAITEHRHQNSENVVRMKWQYLLKNRCPIDQEMLRPTETKHRRNPSQECMNAACPFKITNALLQEILSDPGHPANRFGARIQA